MERKVELLLVTAHAVCAVGAGSRVLVDACAVLAVLLAADEAKHVAVVLLVRGVGDDAAEGFGHAGAELRVGGCGERAGLRFPLSSGDLGAGGGGGVGGGVGVHLYAGGVDLGDLLLEVVEILVGGDLAAVDRCETWSC